MVARTPAFSVQILILEQHEVTALSGSCQNAQLLCKDLSDTLKKVCKPDMATFILDAVETNLVFAQNIGRCGEVNYNFSDCEIQINVHLHA